MLGSCGRGGVGCTASARHGGTRQGWPWALLCVMYVPVGLHPASTYLETGCLSCGCSVKCVLNAIGSDHKGISDNGIYLQADSMGVGKGGQRDVAMDCVQVGWFWFCGGFF